MKYEVLYVESLGDKTDVERCCLRSRKEWLEDHQHFEFKNASFERREGRSWRKSTSRNRKNDCHNFDNGSDDSGVRL